MMTTSQPAQSARNSKETLSLYRLLDPEVLANPYPLYHQLRTQDPVHWDPFLHAWVVTRYADVVRVLHYFSADRTPTPEQLPAMATAELMGVPVADHDQLKSWSTDFAEMLGNFQHNPDRIPRVLRSVEEMTAYFQSAMRELRVRPRTGLIYSFMTAEIEGDRFTDEEIVANCIITMVGGLETT